jgi:hypothetical protein
MLLPAWQAGDPSAAAAVAAAAKPGQSGEHGKKATFAVGAVESTSEAATDAIKLAGGLLTWGIRQAAASAKSFPLMEPTSKPVPVPSAAKAGVGQAREASRQVVHVSGAAFDAAAKLAGAMAGQVSSAASKVAGESGGGGTGWAADARYVGESSLAAGLQVVTTLNEAADQIVQEALGSSANLVVHKFGEEAGSTTREGFHVVGNLMEAKTLVSKKAIAKTLGNKAAVEAATSAANAWGGGPGTTTAIPPPKSGAARGICLGPQPP